jgi:hypothetical protein
MQAGVDLRKLVREFSGQDWDAGKPIWSDMTGSEAVAVYLESK